MYQLIEYERQCFGGGMNVHKFSTQRGAMGFARELVRSEICGRVVILDPEGKQIWAQDGDYAFLDERV